MSPNSPYFRLGVFAKKTICKTPKPPRAIIAVEFDRVGPSRAPNGYIAVGNFRAGPGSSTARAGRGPLLEDLSPALGLVGPWPAPYPGRTVPRLLRVVPVRVFRPAQPT